MSKHICKCCANNKAKFPRVQCRQEPYGDVIDLVTNCETFLTDEQEENFLSYFYKNISEEYWRSLNYQEQNELRIKILKQI